VYHTDFALIEVAVRASIRYTITLADTRVEFWQMGGEQPGSLHILFHLRRVARRSWCCCAGTMAEKQRQRFQREAPAPGSSSTSDGAAAPAMGQHLWSRSKRAGPICSQRRESQLFSPLPGFTATLSSKRRNNIVESRETIGFKSIVHKERISHSL
jgi:hypothetical protein